MTAKDYPIYFPYGATTPPYSPSSPHRGDDRCNEWGVPVVINGVTIGNVGATGKAVDARGNVGTPAAAHLHIQEWKNNYANTRKPQNSFKPGVVTAVANSIDFGNYVTIKCPDGWNTTYAHLSKVNVKTGQEITDMYKDHDAKYWYLQYVKERRKVAQRDKWLATWRNRYLSIIEKLKSLVGK